MLHSYINLSLLINIAFEEWRDPSVGLLIRIALLRQTFFHIVSARQRDKAAQPETNCLFRAGIDTPEAGAAGDMKHNLSVFYVDIFCGTITNAQPTLAAGFFDYCVLPQQRKNHCGKGRNNTHFDT